MTDTKQAYISNVVYVLNFKTPQLKIRFQQAEAEAAFREFVGAQSQQTNLPDTAAPAHPRIVFQAGSKGVALSQTACQLQLSFEKMGLSFTDQIELVKKDILQFHKRALEFLNSDEYGMSGLVVDVNFPSDEPQGKLHKFVYDQFIKPEPIGEVVTAQVTIGFKINDLFLNLSTSVYEVREFQLVPGMTAVHQIQFESQPISEIGIAVKIDVNDRPRGQVEKNVCPPHEFINTIDEFLKTKFVSVTGLQLEA
jgi:hypothetical protein